KSSASCSKKMVYTKQMAFVSSTEGLRESFRFRDSETASLPDERPLRYETRDRCALRHETAAL
ncbi:MAG: hypothetical protein AAFS00_10380, partial [Bacteroidota bacterium]